MIVCNICLSLSGLFHLLYPLGPSMLLQMARSHVFKSFCLFVSLFLRESVSWEGQRERETQNPKWDPGSELSAQSPMLDINS